MNANPTENRVLLLTPTRKDATTAAKLLDRVEVEACQCDGVRALCEELARGAAAILVAEESLCGEGLPRIGAAVAEQPPWSDLPVLVITRGGHDSAIAAKAMQTLGNVTLIERPVRVPTFVSAIRTAIRSRRRQYLIREYLEERKRTEETLRENDRRKDEFLAMLAHELRNPLSAISNAVQIVKRPDAVAHYPWASGVIETHVGHLARMIDDLLDVSRITRGKIKLKIEPVDLSDVVHQAVESARPFIEERKHTLVTTLDAGPIPGKGDPTRLEQIFVNLLNNAAKYTEPGGTVTVNVRVEEREMVFSVEDDGIGMSPDLVARAFELFVQGDRAMARSEGGLGIGLTLVRSLVGLHDGSVTADSDGPGRGSRFTVRLPLAGARADANGRATGRPAGEDGAVRILVVDDNIDAAEGLAQLLGLFGHDVRTAYDGHAALREAGEMKPEVVLLDIGLPGMDGFEVARRFRKEGFAHALIVAISGYGEEQALKRSQESGFDHYLVKPVDFELLRDLIAANAKTRPTRPARPTGPGRRRAPEARPRAGGG